MILLLETKFKVHLICDFEWLNQLGLDSSEKRGSAGLALDDGVAQT